MELIYYCECSQRQLVELARARGAILQPPSGPPPIQNDIMGQPSDQHVDGSETSVVPQTPVDVNAPTTGLHMGPVNSAHLATTQQVRLYNSESQPEQSQQQHQQTHIQPPPPQQPNLDGLDLMRILWMNLGFDEFDVSLFQANIMLGDLDRDFREWFNPDSALQYEA